MVYGGRVGFLMGLGESGRVFDGFPRGTLGKWGGRLGVFEGFSGVYGGVFMGVFKGSKASGVKYA